MRSVFAVVKRLLAGNIITYIVTAVVVVCATTAGDSEAALSNGNYTWLAAVMAPFFVVCCDCKKMMYLGTSKKDYYLGRNTCGHYFLGQHRDTSSERSA